MNLLQQAYLNKGPDYTPRTQHVDDNGQAKFTNHLIFQSSPYLLQHAHNPIDWYAFGDEAFDKAKKENKLLFISIGYATCHWCHVMEEESFDDTEVAALLNAHFVSIKVDREIRSDVDTAYMNVAMLIHGSGGWPLNAILLPNGQAFFAGTYFPKSRLLGMMQQIHSVWQSEPEKIRQQASEIHQRLNAVDETPPPPLQADLVHTAVNTLLNNFDTEHGGFGKPPKFPHETMLLSLLDAQQRQPQEALHQKLTQTLDYMVRGGFYDVVGGGFHRYSTDNHWLVPHFEKMLYNQSQLALVYSRAYRLNPRPLYRRIAQHTLDYVLREMAAPPGGFFSATDADSEGAEGTFFVWSVEALKTTLSEEEWQTFNHWFDLSPSSLFEERHIVRFSQVQDLDNGNTQALDDLLKTLYTAREQRVPPLTDHKVLLSWNAQLLSTLLHSADLFDHAGYRQTAVNLGHYLHQHFYPSSGLYRVSINGQPEGQALCEDYAYLANAYLDLFDAQQDRVWLERAIALLDTMTARFWDSDHYGFFMTDDQNYLNSRHKDVYDNAMPSANGLAYQALLKIHQRTGEVRFKQQAEQLIGAFADTLNQSPDYYSALMLGYSQSQQGEVGAVQYACEGNIRLHSQRRNGQLRIGLTWPEGWSLAAKPTLWDEVITPSHSETQFPPALSQIQYPEDTVGENNPADKGTAEILANFVPVGQIEAHTAVYLTLHVCREDSCLPPVTLRIWF